MEHGERLNTITHLAGALLAAGGAVALIAKAIASGDDWKLVASAGFGLSMLLLYSASTMYHASSGARKAMWARIDHCAIYVLIAGTYMPFALVTLRGSAGWALMAVVFALALLGISKELWWGRHSMPSVPLYLATGWIGVAALVPVTQRLDPGGLIGLLGGPCFTPLVCCSTTSAGAGATLMVSGTCSCWAAPAATISPSCCLSCD